MAEKLADKLRIQFLEAEVETGFGLVDDARAYRACGQDEFSERALQAAMQVVASIEGRTKHLDRTQAIPFQPLVDELRYEIASAAQNRS